MSGRPARRPAHSRNRLLRTEVLEPREMLSASRWLAAASPIKVAVNAAPVVAQAIRANTAINTASLSVLGRDDGGEARLNYTWSVVAAPVGSSVIFSANGTNAARNTTAQFTRAGTYSFSVRITDAAGLSVVNTKSVVATQTVAGLVLTTSGGQVIAPNSTLTVGGTTQGIVAQAVDQFGSVMTTPPSYTWTLRSASRTSAPVLSAKAGAANITFRSVGVYSMVVQAKARSGAPISKAFAMNVVPNVTARNVPAAQLTTAGTGVQFATPTFVDQFGKTQPVTVSWSATTLPDGATAPTFGASGGMTNVTFAMAGDYTLTGRLNGVAGNPLVTRVLVNQTLSSAAVTPGSVTLGAGGTQQFTAQGYDQFRRAMASNPGFVWSTSAGSISSSGLFTAPSSGAATIRATVGSVVGSATATVGSSGNWQNAALGSLVQSLVVDGSISRNDMIQILRSTGLDGVVDTTEYADLRTVLVRASTLNMPSYVQVLAADVINGNVANATFQGQSLGNLAAGSSATVLNKLVDKWFLGADHPTLTSSSYVYRSATGSLFPRTPTHLDEYQGMLGDCYFISALGSLADNNPTAVQNMFIDNGDGTFTVRFYTGSYGNYYNSDGTISAGFRGGVGTADYVTVDRYLATTSSGMFVYSNYGFSVTNTSAPLWIALAEKAYAQWNETVKEGRDGRNTYASIEGGWMSTVDAQVLGYNGTNYYVASTAKQVAINALAAHKAVTIGTNQLSGTVYGLYGTHAYGIVGYNASNDTFTLYNPWGSNQPGALTWAQLQSTCSVMCVADPSGTVAIQGAVVRSPGVHAAGADQLGIESVATSEASAPLADAPSIALVVSDSSDDSARQAAVLALANEPVATTGLNALGYTFRRSGRASHRFDAGATDAAFTADDLEVAYECLSA